MLVDESERHSLKEWVIPKLEKISDADAGVLADYVIALVAAEETEDAVRHNCLESLSDFLQDHTAPFIDEVLSAVRTKSYLPKGQAIPVSAPQHSPSPGLRAEAPPFNPPTGPSALSKQTSPLNSRGDASRKRRYNERETSQSRDVQDPHYNGGLNGHRPFKEATRRGGRNSRGGIGPGGFAGMPVAPMPSFPGLPTPPPGFPSLDPSNPMSFLAMMGMTFPGLPAIPPTAASGQSSARKGRCRDYDTKGYCALGSACPYEHGGEIVLPPSADGNSIFPINFSALGPLLRTRPEAPASIKRFAETGISDNVPEYDPNQSSLAVESFKGTNKYQGSHQVRARPDVGGSRGGRTRAPFSQPGPNYDRSNSTIVVEQIPEENFSEDAVRGFFSQFGNIVEVTMQAYKRLAIVKYDDYSAARRAYDSPKVIFDNRFVKVYWYKPDTLPTAPAKAGRNLDYEQGPVQLETQLDTQGMSQQDEDMLDPEELEKRQAEAQKAFEERKKKEQEAAARIEEVERKLKENEEQVRLLREQLAKKAKASNGQNGSTTDDATLIEQLSSLQEEAQGLNADYDSYTYRGRGRGRGYRGRGFYPPRGRGFTPFRGSYRGRGYPASPFAGGRAGVKRLDNRPKRIAISGIEAGSKQDEALRQHLLNQYEYDSIEPHPDRANTQIISFKERYMAEMFLDHASDIPDVGKVELAWVPNAASTAKAEPNVSDHLATEGDTKMDDANADEHTTTPANVPADDTNGNTNGGDADYDVADDEDRWMAA